VELEKGGKGGKGGEGRGRGGEGGVREGTDLKSRQRKYSL
jgi:hypothetical protein